MNRMYCVTGVPAGAQEKAAAAGRRRKEEEARGTTPHQVEKHRVRGQVVRAFCGRELAEEFADELLAQGYIVTLRRWRLPR